jgi:hypothetical protein
MTATEINPIDRNNPEQGGMSMHDDELPAVCGRPIPQADWICQQDLAELLYISSRTAANWAAAGELAQFEHGFPSCGRRRYSRLLVERALQRRWQEAIQRQDKLLDGGVHRP